jgi:hypothetical protein
MNKDLELFIRNASTVKIGSFGEMLFAQIMNKKGVPCDPVHSGGVDFLVGFFGKVDVKVVRAEKQSPNANFRRVKKDLQLPEVTYAYIVISGRDMRLYFEKHNEPVINPFIDYPHVVEVERIEEAWLSYVAAHPEPLSSRSKIIVSLKKELREWIRSNWHKSARIIHRGDREWNENMEKRHWGADNFYEQDNTKYNMVVLLLLDNDSVYRVMAYPLSERDAIDWKDKDVGPNTRKIVSFDPSQIEPRFVFDSIDQFKNEFNLRFSSNI